MGAVYHIDVIFQDVTPLMTPRGEGDGVTMTPPV